jgi:DNA topoisomerase VI subunit B
MSVIKERAAGLQTGDPIDNNVSDSETTKNQAEKQEHSDAAAPREHEKRPRRAALVRTVFTTSRLVEFCTEKELVNQTGHPVEEWPLVILKETVDNALDACEEAGVAPVVNIFVGNSGIEVTDNGPGIAADTIGKILDFEKRTSSREAYVSPTRGAQGNALKTIVAMPFALDNDVGETVVIESREAKHTIVFSTDPVRQEPRVYRTCEASNVKIGSRITVAWPVSASEILDGAWTRFLQNVRNYCCSNPHLTLTLTWDRGEEEEAVKFSIAATDPNWRKWTPSDPTSPHWYDEGRLGRLMAAYVAHAEDNELPQRTLREFVSEFRGLSGSLKARDICEAVGGTRQTLAGFFGDGNRDRISALAAAMREASRPIKPRDLGLVGHDHILANFEGFGVGRGSFKYKCGDVVVDGVPYLVEVAFGYISGSTRLRRIVTGINWSPAIDDPFRQLSEWKSLSALLSDLMATASEPVVVFVPVASPRIEYLDRGKSSAALPMPVRRLITDFVTKVTAAWTRQKRAEARNHNAELRREDAMLREERVTVKDAAYEVMRKAYMAASGNGKLPAEARQIMYAARPAILAMTGKQTLTDSYFTQTLLLDYIAEHAEECANWDVVFDDRGHFIEPHTDKEIGIGTIAIRDYTGGYGSPRLEEAELADAKIVTGGPDGRYGDLFYVEKEGFDPLFKHVKLRERYDIAFASCKGQSVTAARRLVDKTCARYGLRLFILHDFDISGFSIKHNLHNSNRRYTFETEFEAIDLGLRLVDVEHLGLQSERVSLGNKDPDTVRETLRDHGATQDEIDFLLSGRRVELNAMTSDQLVAFVEQKLAEHGVKKVVPAKELLNQAYHLFKREQRIREIVERALAEDDGDVDTDVPDDLRESVNEYLEENPTEPWDDAVRAIVEADDE